MSPNFRHLALLFSRPRWQSHLRAAIPLHEFFAQPPPRSARIVSRTHCIAIVVPVAAAFFSGGPSSPDFKCDSKRTAAAAFFADGSET
jgi:hypothetical protein